MTAPDSKLALRWVSAVIIVIAVALAFNAVNTLLDLSRRLKEYVGYSIDVREEEKADASSAAAIRMFEELPDPHPVPLADLLKKSFSGDKFEIVEKPADPTVEGWQTLRREVTLPEIQLARLGAFLGVVVTQRPPWRLVSCRIASSGPQGGTARVSLTFDAMEKTPQ
ncbi:MAG: hypothetical protein WCN95_07100 [bacterium]